MNQYDVDNVNDSDTSNDLARALDESADRRAAAGWLDRMRASTNLELQRPVATTIVAVAAAGVAVWHTSLASAAPAGLGLGFLASTDLANRRLPEGLMLATLTGSLAAGAFDASRLGNSYPFFRAWMIVGIVLLGVGILWAVTSGFAWGDVKLLALASFVPAFIAPHQVIVMLVAALLAAFVVVIGDRFRRPNPWQPTIAFGPPVLVGWLVAVMFA